MTRKEFLRVFKRFLIAFLCCLPIFILIGIFLTDKIGNVWTIVIYVVIGAGAYVLAEVLCRRHEKKMEEKREKSRLMRRYKNLNLDKKEKTEKEDLSKNKKNSKKDEKTKE